MSEFEEAWHIRFNEEETGLIAVIFGARLMQKSDLHEKQVLLLTDDNPAIEEATGTTAARTNAAAAEYQIPERRALSEGRVRPGVTLIVTPMRRRCRCFRRR